jgi:biopolymer transport protein ExbD
MKKNRERKVRDQPKLEMTPMIDVVFLLLIFFIVTLKQEDIFSRLDVNRPTADQNTKPPRVDLLEIVVYNEERLGGEGFSFRGRAVSLEYLEKRLRRIGQYSSTISVIIKCEPDSRHERLVQLLDVCAAAGLKNLSVFSL